MKAVVMHEYGGPDVLKFEDVPDPTVGEGDVLVKVAAASINPLDLARRSGMAKSFFPVQFPGIIGADLSGTVVAVGPGVTSFAPGDRVFGMAHQAYAELCAAKAANLAKVPEGLDLVEAAGLPLAASTGAQLVSDGTKVGAGQTIIVTGAAGSVGRAAVYTAKQRGATVIAAILTRHRDQVADIHAEQAVATDDDAEMASLPQVDAVADAVSGKTAAQLIGRVKPGGVFASVLPPPQNASEFPRVRIVPMRVHPDSALLVTIANGVLSGALKIPIRKKFPLSEAAAGHAAFMAKGGSGKILLVP